MRRRNGQGKLFVIAGTDGSGKETQTRMLVDRLEREGIPVNSMSFPLYEEPSGALIGAYLGKRESGIHIVENMFKGIDPSVIQALRDHPKELVGSVFPEGPDAVLAKAASLYYAADRVLAKGYIDSLLGSGINVVLDRYVSANMGHQGGKLPTRDERRETYDFLEKLEFGLLRLPEPDGTAFLYVPAEYSIAAKKGMDVELDGHEGNEGHIRNAERAYLELAKRYKWHKIDCVQDGVRRTPEEDHEEVYSAFMAA